MGAWASSISASWGGFRRPSYITCHFPFGGAAPPLRPKIWSAVEGLVLSFAANDARGMARNLIAWSPGVQVRPVLSSRTCKGVDPDPGHKWIGSTPSYSVFVAGPFGTAQVREE